jgi:hypothetical protein
MILKVPKTEVIGTLAATEKPVSFDLKPFYFISESDSQEFIVNR